MHNCYILTYKSGLLEEFGRWKGSILTTQRNLHLQGSYSIADLRIISDRSEQNSSKLRHTVCDPLVGQSAVSGYVCIIFVWWGNFLLWTFQSNSALNKARKLSFKTLFVIGYLVPPLPPFSGVQDFIPCWNLNIVSETFAEDCFLSVHISFVSGVSTRCSRLSQFPRIIRWVLFLCMFMHACVHVCLPVGTHAHMQTQAFWRYKVWGSHRGVAKD
jgi:hypothetical protein